ncbi:VWA domain-containing protein [Microcoleus sp.]|uniref:VWA domain-containing protein n=1 Tax=Microcoleus sp. TaxID=44472 RepID=UPI003524FBC7
MQLLKDDVLLGSSVDVSAIAPLEEEIKGDSILSYASDTRSASQLGASSSFISTFDGLSGQVGTIDPSAKFTQIASTFSFSDIAVSKDGTIFGITPTQLFKIDPVSGLTSFVGGLPAGVNMNALEFANDILYAAGDSNLYAINTTNAGAYLIANLESAGFNSSGDLAFDAPNNRFLATSKGLTSDSLYAVSLTGEAAKIGDIGFSNILALMFEGEKLFGFTADGSRIAINPGTGAGVFDTLVKGISDRIGGASGIQIKKGEVLSSTPGTILSADTIDVFLPPGGEITLEITVTVPGDGSEPIRSVRSIENGDRSASVVTNQLPLDVFLLQDASASFEDDVPIFRRLVPNLVDTLSNQQPNTQFGLGSFVDKPIKGIGSIEAGHYVYRTNLPLTKDENKLQLAVNNLTILPNNEAPPESSLEALLQTARRADTNEIGFRDSARRVVVVATDAPFYQAGDGAILAGIRRPNNGDAILDGNPPGTGEDYPSIQQVREALIDAGIVPIFAVTPTSENTSVYNDLVNKLGFGKVVRLDSDSANLVNAITEGLDKVSQEITLVPADDDFKYVKDISPKKFENVKPGDKLTFKVTLKSDSTGRDDNLKLQIPGFGNLGDTKINVKTVAPNKPIVTKLPNAPQLTEIKDSYISGKIYDDTNNDKFFSDDPKDRESRPVTIKTFNGAKVDPNAETWILIHGNVDNPNKDKMFDLAKAVEEQVAGKKSQVLVIDWSESANNYSFGKPDPGLSANWISDVANFAVEALRDEWKIASEKINLIGHSLGTYVASEIGFLLSSRDKDRSKLNIDPDKRVNTLIALDPAVNDPRNALGYDLDGDTNDIRETPIQFSPVSKFSRAFWGDIATRDGTGSSDYATSANESIYIDFKRQNRDNNEDNFDSFDSHGNMVYLYRNLLKNPGEIGSLFKLDVREHKDWKKDTYGGNEAILVATAYKDEGKFDYKPFNDNDPNTEPKLLFLKDANPQNDDIAYASTGDDNLDADIVDRNSFLGLYKDGTFNDAGNDKLYGDSGNDTIFSGSGNDTLYGGSGNDFINGEADNDLIEGGDNDDTIFGAKGDDTVIGGKGNDSLEGNDGKDTLIGGEDNDTLWGGGGNWADYLDGGDGNDSLIGEDGDDTLIGGIGKDTLSGGFDSDTFVIRRNEGIRIKDNASREELKNGIDLITDFGTSGFRGTDKIKLIDLSFGDLDFQKLERGFLNPVQDTAIRIKSTGEYLAFLEGVSKDSINKNEFFI